MCEIYGFCGKYPSLLNDYTDVFWSHSEVHRDGFGYYLADKDDFFVSTLAAKNYRPLATTSFLTSLGLFHIRFKTHGGISLTNCHPFIEKDNRGIQWALIHNGYIEDTPQTEVLKKYQTGETDSERILLSLIETINHFYDYSYTESEREERSFLYAILNHKLQEMSHLGKLNLIFTDNKTNNMYVFMNHARTLHIQRAEEGVHIATTPLYGCGWEYIEPLRLHIFNAGEQIR